MKAFASVLAAEPDAKKRDAIVKQAKMLAMNGASREGLEITAAPLTFDLDAEPDPPRWVIVGQLERRQVAVLSADTGAAKSIVSQSLAVQAVGDLDWLGYETRAQRVLYIDEENPGLTVERRLKAMGLQPDELGTRLHYFNREGLSIGDDGKTDAWLQAECEAFKPDLIIIDTLMAATAIADTNDNGLAVRMMKHVRGLAERFDAGVLVLHHERKQSLMHPNSTSQMAMGARQWIGQADVQMTMKIASVMERSQEGLISEAAVERLRKSFSFLPGDKDREGELNRPVLVSVTSEKGEEKRLLWMLVENEGEALTEDEETARDSVAQQIGAWVQAQEGEQKTAAIAKGVNRKAEDPTFKRGLAEAEKAKYVTRVKRGSYAAGTERALGA